MLFNYFRNLPKNRYIFLKSISTRFLSFGKATKIIFLNTALFTIVFSSLQCTHKKEPEFLLHASHLVNENHTWYQAFEYFAKILEERSNGRIVVKNYHSEQLAKEIEAIRLIQAGVIDMTTTGSMLNNWIDIVAFCELPFMLRDSNSTHWVFPERPQTPNIQ